MRAMRAFLLTLFLFRANAQVPANCATITDLTTICAGATYSGSLIADAANKECAGAPCDVSDAAVCCGYSAAYYAALQAAQATYNKAELDSAAALQAALQAAQAAELAAGDAADAVQDAGYGAAADIGFAIDTAKFSIANAPNAGYAAGYAADAVQAAAAAALANQEAQDAAALLNANGTPPITSVDTSQNWLDAAQYARRAEAADQYAADANAKADATVAQAVLDAAISAASEAAGVGSSGVGGVTSLVTLALQGLGETAQREVLKTVYNGVAC
jgi:hypothetical protein